MTAMILFLSAVAAIVLAAEPTGMAETVHSARLESTGSLGGLNA